MEIMEMGFSTIPAIVVVCYLIGMAAKACKKISNEIIPIVVCVAGGILGPIALVIIPEFPAVDVLTAVAIGIVSGLSSTGANQIVKIATVVKE